MATEKRRADLAPFFVSAFAAQLRLSGYTRTEEMDSRGLWWVCFIDPERRTEPRGFAGCGPSIKQAERSAIGSYLEWARTGTMPPAPTT